MTRSIYPTAHVQTKTTIKRLCAVCILPSARASGARYSTIRGNIFVRSGVVLDPYTPMILENNTFIQNQTGAIFADPANSGATRNVLVKSSGTGIKSAQPGLPVGHNTAIYNGGHGIDTLGAVDLGGNVAFQNKLGQCVGVVCAGR